MLWLILVALSVAGRHWVLALLYAASALASQPRRHAAATVRAQAPAGPTTPYDQAVALQQARRFQLIKGDIR